MKGRMEGRLQGGRNTSSVVTVPGVDAYQGRSVGSFRARLSSTRCPAQSAYTALRPCDFPCPNLKMTAIVYGYPCAPTGGPHTTYTKTDRQTDRDVDIDRKTQAPQIYRQIQTHPTKPGKYSTKQHSKDSSTFPVLSKLKKST